MAKAKKPAAKTADVFDLINAKFGKRTIATMADAPDEQYDVISTGSIALDKATGIGGMPRGRIIEIYGPESSGKTTLSLHMMANAQKRGLTCAFVDAEHALDMKYARALGVDTDQLYISQPDYGEQALEIVDMLARSGEVGMIIVDSVAALVPKAELEGDVGDFHVGLAARMMSQAMRKLKGVASQSNTMVVFINQLRMKIGVKFGSPETTTGGNALKFYASLRLDTRRIGGVKEGDTLVANRTRVRFKKNKVAPPFTEAEFNIKFGSRTAFGIDRQTELIELGVFTKVVDQSGAWFSHDGERLGQGRAKSAVFLEEHPEVSDKIEQKIRAKLDELDAGALPSTPREDPKAKAKPVKAGKQQSTSAVDAVAALTSKKTA